MNTSTYNRVRSFFSNIIILSVLYSPLAVYGASLVTVSTGPAVVTPSTTTLFATVDSRGSPTYAWFEYGQGNSLKTQTKHSFVSMYAKQTSLSIEINGLEKGITYSYRVGAYNAYGTAYGQMRTFIAGVSGSGSNTPPPVSDPVPAATDSRPANPPATVSNAPKQPVASASVAHKTQSSTPKENSCTELPGVRVRFVPEETIIEPQETYTYAVLVANKTSKEIRNLVLTVQLPAQVLFVKNSTSTFAYRNSVLTSEETVLAAQSEKMFPFRVKTASKLDAKDVFLLAGLARFPDVNNQRMEAGYAIMSVAEQKTPAENASVLGAFSSSPASSALFLWIVVTLLTLVAVFTGATLYIHIKNNKKEPPETGTSG